MGSKCFRGVHLLLVRKTTTMYIVFTINNYLYYQVDDGGLGTLNQDMNHLDEPPSPNPDISFSHDPDVHPSDHGVQWLKKLSQCLAIF